MPIDFHTAKLIANAAFFFIELLLFCYIYLKNYFTMKESLINFNNYFV